MTSRSVTCCLGFVSLMGISGFALNGPAHRAVNLAAAGVRTSDQYSATFDEYLRESLGLAKGRDTILQPPQRTAEDLLADGGEREDDGFPFSAKARFYRHFHNPLLSWEQAGLLTRYPFHLDPHQYTSSVRWMQADDQTHDDGGANGGTWSWRDARRLQYLVLTTDDPSRREAYAADLFRALGQVMHLVVDASVPEHVRNDAHPLGTVAHDVLRSRTAGNYEYWVSERQAMLGDSEFTARYLSAPIGPDAGFQTLPPPPGEPVAKVPVARLLDTDRYQGEAPDPNATLTGPIGLAEFANANFFSEDTLFGADPHGRRLPFPRREDLKRRTDRAPLSPRIRAYLEKPAGQGLATTFALAECRLEGRAAALPPYPCVDEAVWDETASHMLPRAVGYARAVLDHFFRGRLQVQTSLMRSLVPRIQISNLTGEEMTGVFEVFGRPEAESSGEGRESSARINDGAPVTIGAYGSVVLPIAYLRPEHPTPSQILVFRGRLGLEEDAVAAQTFSVPHVLIAQTSHTADLSETCTVTSNGSRQSPLRSEKQRCVWLSIRQQTDGELITNSSVAAIVGVSVSHTAKGAELLLDGTPVPTGAWQRHGSEPDPRTFAVRWAWLTGAGPGQPLPALTVRLVDGTSSTVPIYGSINAVGESGKLFTDTSAGSAPPWYIAVQRMARISVAPMAPYEVTTVAGHPNPTYLRTDGFGVPALADTLEVDASLVGEVRGYLQRWTDYATVHWTAPENGPVQLHAPFNDEFEALSYGPAPRVPVEAVLERTFRSSELGFLRAFVTTDVLPSRLTVVGRRPSGP